MYLAEGTLPIGRAAMKKLGFLVGKWNGEARLLRGSGEWMYLHQSEEAQYKLDGLILVIEGVGRTKSDGHSVLQALGVISFDDETATLQRGVVNSFGCAMSRLADVLIMRAMATVGANVRVLAKNDLFATLLWNPVAVKMRQAGMFACLIIRCFLAVNSKASTQTGRSAQVAKLG